MVGQQQNSRTAPTMRPIIILLSFFLPPSLPFLPFLGASSSSSPLSFSGASSSPPSDSSSSPAESLPAASSSSSPAPASSSCSSGSSSGAGTTNASLHLGHFTFLPGGTGSLVFKTAPQLVHVIEDMEAH